MRIIPFLASSKLTNKWAGGKTTQLFIYPPTAEYFLRNFDFRISTATIEVEESTFTSLTNYNRILMILKGELLISHEGHYSKKIRPFEMDEFDGNWQTSSHGMVTDFNIMFTKNKTAVLVAHQLKANDKLPILIKTPSCFGYLVSGKVLLNQKTILNAGDFIVFENGEDISIQAELDSCWLQMKIGS